MNEEVFTNAKQKRGRKEEENRFKHEQFIAIHFFSSSSAINIYILCTSNFTI